LAVVSGGGGGDAYPVLRAYADALDAITAAGLKTAMFLGPDLPPAQRTELKRLLLPRSGDLLLFDFRPDLVSFLPHAAVTVSMAGYNTIAELLAHEKRAVVVPRVYPRREQWLRAHALQDLGLLRCIDPERLSPAAVVQAVAEARMLGTTPSMPIDFGGLRRITRAARRLLRIPDAPTA
jgi:predicted glycosyltransferase